MRQKEGTSLRPPNQGPTAGNTQFHRPQIEPLCPPPPAICSSSCVPCLSNCCRPPSCSSQKPAAYSHPQLLLPLFGTHTRAALVLEVHLQARHRLGRCPRGPKQLLEFRLWLGWFFNIMVSSCLKAPEGQTGWCTLDIYPSTWKVQENQEFKISLG